MSYDLGHSKSYINNISSGKALPRAEELIAICDYFEIEPKDFFDDGIDDAPSIRKALNGLKKLSDDDVQLVLSLISKLPPKEDTSK